MNPFGIDPDSLTLGELALIEELTGWQLAKILVSFSGSGILESAQFLLALQVIAGHRADPNYTLADARQVRFLDLAGIPAGQG